MTGLLLSKVCQVRWDLGCHGRAQDRVCFDPWYKPDDQLGFEQLSSVWWHRVGICKSRHCFGLKEGQGITLIKYALRCEHNHEFEGWFRNSEDCEAQTRSGHLECPVCGSTVIAKSLMAPRVSGTRSQNAPQTQEGLSSAPLPSPNLKEAPGQEEHTKMQDMLRAYRKHVVDSSDYVGDKFAEEARKMHFNEAESRGIYGEATMDEVKSLTDDGIDCLPLPVLPEDQN